MEQTSLQLFDINQAHGADVSPAIRHQPESKKRWNFFNLAIVNVFVLYTENVLAYALEKRYTENVPAYALKKCYTQLDFRIDLEK